ncbi:DeoR/GlpR family DNA-binding transcription regulator [Pectinatus frisingensis]|uniref:DeoR/GlpR family DNA-binding transcription regulator n=1 Tax=Pectinatus frisingensis TaxID=865 RepID=UPI0018C6D8AE|nr:DeoR/GlpR family DNA-binding transcription regulator [Pectinatus frisingensis]
MFVQERREKIIALLETSGKVLVKDLSDYFKVTDDCIRKDLAFLEKKGLLKRAYGGAVTERKNTHQLKAAQRRVNIAEKKIIAEKAIKLINNGDVVFLDISTINIELVKLIIQQGLKISIITNMIDIMNILQTARTIDMTFIGGTLDSSGDGFIGALAGNIIDKLHFDMAFMGTVGIDIHRKAVYTYKPEDGFTKRKAVDAADKTYVLAETEKFNRSGNFLYAAISDFDVLITEKKLPIQLLKQLEKYNIEVM